MRMADHGAIAVGGIASRTAGGWLPLLREMRAATNVPLAAQPAAFQTRTIAQFHASARGFP